MSNTLQDDQVEGNQLTCASNNREHHQAKAFPQEHKHVLGRKKITLSRRSKKRPLVPPQRRKYTVSDENSQPANNCNKKKLLTPLRERCNQNKLTNKLNCSSDTLMPLNRASTYGETSECFINPVSCFSPYSSSPECLTEIEPILETLAGESNVGSPVKLGGLWQLFDSDLGDE